MHVLKKVAKGQRREKLREEEKTHGPKKFQETLTPEKFTKIGGDIKHDS